MTTWASRSPSRSSSLGCRYDFEARRLPPSSRERPSCLLAPCKDTVRPRKALLAIRLDAVAGLGAAEIYLNRFEDAVRHLTRGLDIGRSTGQGQLFSLLTQELGVALGLLGRLAEAREHLESAVEAARLYRDKAERQLRRLGKRHHRRRGSSRPEGDGVEALTKRELEVAELVRDHKTNREIAAELFLSEKTIETHLRHIFGKLGVSSRAAVARAIEDTTRKAGTPET